MDYDFKNEISSSSKPYISNEDRKSYLERLIHRLSRRRRRRQEADTQAQAYAELTRRDQERALRLPSEERRMLDREAREERERLRMELQRNREILRKEEEEIKLRQEEIKLRQEQIKLRQEKLKRLNDEEILVRNNDYQWERHGGGWIMAKIPPPLPPLTRQQQWEIDFLPLSEIRDLDRMRRYGRRDP